MDVKCKNSAVNNLEIAKGKIKLTSTPQYITIGAHYKCNANCIFCLGGNYPEFNLDIYRERFEPKILHVMKNAESVGFCGYGEILLMPGIIEFLDHINRMLPGINKVFTTNGLALTPSVCQKLTEERYSIIISMHSSHAELHNKLTGIKNFRLISDQIRNLAVMRKSDRTKPHINLSFLLTATNIDNLPSFVAFANGIGADMISCSYLTIFEPSQLKMSTFFMKEKTNEIMLRAEEEAKKCGITLCLPPKYIKHEVKASEGVTCRDPWEFFYVETQGSVNPCCYAGNHIGYLEKQSFEDIWNGQGYTELRDGLVTGNIHNWCKSCVKYNPNNVNDIRSHITFRPETQKKILNYIKEFKNEFPTIDQEIEL